MRTLLLLICCLTASNAMAWSVEYDNIDKGWYAIEESTQYYNAFVAVYYLPSAQCAPVLGFITLLPDAWQEEKAGKRTIKFRVDKGTVWVGEAAYVLEEKDAGKYNYRQIVGLKLSEDQAHEIMTGSRLLMSPDDTKEDDNTAYPLAGSRRAMETAKSECFKKLNNNEWDTHTTSQPYSGDEWSI